MIEMNENDVVLAALGHLMIEGDRTQLTGVRMAQTFHAARPRTRQRRHFENSSARRTRQFDWLERWPLFQREAGLDRRANPFGREVKISLRFLKALVQFLDAFFDMAFGPNVSLGLCSPSLGLSRIQFPPCALDQTGHLRRDNGVHASHVLAHRLQFDEGADDVVLVAAKRISGRFAAIHRVPDQNFVMLLAMSIDPAVALLHDVRIVGNLDVDQAIAVVLQVDAFGRGVGGEQDTNIGILRVRLECGFDLLPLFLIHAAMNDPETVSAISVRGEDLMKPLMRRAVFGEKDDAAVVPLAVRSQVGLDPFDNCPAFRIHLVTGALSPVAHPGKQA